MTPSFEAQATPPGLTLPDVSGSPGWIRTLCEALKAARPALADRDASELATALGRAGERFLDPGDPIRREALELLPEASALSPEMATVVLDAMAVDWTGPRLLALLEAELGDAAVLDHFVQLEGTWGTRRSMAVGPALCLQVVAGSVPGVGVNALLRSLLVKGPTLLKPGRGDAVLPLLFARAIADLDRGLASALAVVYWPGGSTSLEDAALEAAEVVTVYGSDATVAELRARAPVTARVVAYHHRVSVGVVGREALTADSVRGTAADVARSLAIFDQRGCVSPQLVFVEEGGHCTAAEFAEALATALGEFEETLPAGPLDAAEASALHQARDVAELTAGTDGDRVIHGGQAPWSVLWEANPGAGGSPFPSIGRVARVRPIREVEELFELLRPLSAHLQTVGCAGLGVRLEDCARELGRIGAVRVAPFSAVPFPPPWWHHDGGGPLTDLVRWVDLES